METPYINAHKWKLHTKTYILYTQCVKIYKHIWSKSHYGNSGMTSFIILQKIDVHMDDAPQTDL